MLEDLVKEVSDNGALLKIFEEERERLRLPCPIQVVFLQPPDIEEYRDFREWYRNFNSYSTGYIKNDDGTFTVNFNPLAYKNSRKFRRAARHELYHIHRDGDKDKIGVLRGIFGEITAELYACLGIKL